jgi:multidrug transporter EmrE-like cation transporter
MYVYVCLKYTYMILCKAMWVQTMLQYLDSYKNKLRSYTVVQGYFDEHNSHNTTHITMWHSIFVKVIDNLYFASYFSHPFIFLTLALSPIRKHARYALWKLFTTRNQAVQKWFFLELSDRSQGFVQIFCILLLAPSKWVVFLGFDLFF